MSTLKLSNKVGKLGEDITVKKLISQNYKIVHRNWLEKTGEIDIVAEKDNKIYFIEVKSVSCENFESISDIKFRPEENMHSAKISRLHKTIATYLFKNNNLEELQWQLDLYCVYINQKSKTAKIVEFKNIV